MFLFMFSGKQTTFANYTSVTRSRLFLGNKNREIKVKGHSQERRARRRVGGKLRFGLLQPPRRRRSVVLSNQQRAF